MWCKTIGADVFARADGCFLCKNDQKIGQCRELFIKVKRALLLICCYQYSINFLLATTYLHHPIVNMVRITTRQRVIQQLEDEISQRQEAAMLRLVTQDDSDDSGNSSDNSSATLEDLYDASLTLLYNRVVSTRYVESRAPLRINNCRHVFERDLQREEVGIPRPWLGEDEFLHKYRMKRESFDLLLELIEGHAVFQRTSRRIQQAPVAWQLLVFLHYIGCSGSGASNPNLRNMFGIGRGTADLYKRRCVTAILSLRERVIKWPDVDERKEIALRINLKYDFLNCIAVADGTLFPLQYAPQTVDAPDYHGRKFAYSLSVMIINNDNCKIRAYMAGFPGSAHDNRVYRNMPQAQSPLDYFGRAYYLVGDSAFTNLSTVVSAFKKPAGRVLPREEERFNTLLGRLRVKSEHTIGILKGRFQFLTMIPMIITSKRNSLKRILRFIDACIILHNLLIEVGDVDIPEEWLAAVREAADVGEAIGEFDYARDIFDYHENDERRQRQMVHFINLNMI